MPSWRLRSRSAGGGGRGIRLRLTDFQDFSVLFNPGDVVKFRPVDEPEFREIERQVEAGTWVYKQAPFTFVLKDALADPEAYNKTILEVLNGAQHS